MAFSDVVLATEEAAADAARRYPPIGPWIQAGPTEVSIRAAAIALAAYGGGTIMLPPKQITLTSPLPYLPGITYQGIPPKVLQQNVTAGTWLGDGEWDYVGGTRLVGDGTFAAFEANPTDQASVQSDIGNTQISNGGIYGIGVDNFTYGIHIGAQNIMGMVYGKIDKFFAKNCSQWGVKLVNFQHVAIGEILTCLCQNGQYYGALMPGLTLYPGNLEIGEIFNLIPRDGRDNRKCRGIVFEIGGTNAALNEVLVRRAQCNGFNRANLSTTVTLTSGSTSVSVPDGTNFLPGMVVNFTTTNFGFTLGQAYVIQSVSGNTITIGNGKTTAAISATGSGTLTMNTRGFPNIEVSSLNTGAQLSNSQFFQLDTEGTASCGLWLENITGCTFGLADIPATIVAAHVVGRTVKFSEIRCQNAAVTDFDANSTTSTYYGARGAAYQRPLKGFWVDTVNGVNGLNIGSGGNNQGTLPDLHNRSGNFIYPRAGMGSQVFFRDTSITLGGANTGRVVFAGTAVATYTLPTIVTDTSPAASHIGMYFDICNVGTANLTVATDGTQVMNKVSGRTSVTVAPGNSVVVTAVKDAGGNLFWLAKASALVS